ncbi:MAG TPA: RecQ family ATP-dependent DNA helicase [Bacteroidetes bacterium]|nr:RecQ family ATP-dependent DNA helicase [Bacteroidota bacterium]
MTDDAPLRALRQSWGYDGFRPGQREAIAAVCAGRDAFAVLPTGGGKSLVYQIPALVRPGVALVVSPLIALMRDQVDALAARGIRAGLAHSGLSLRQQDQLWTDAEHGLYRLVYVTPERLQTDLFQTRAPRLPVSLLAIDEAHCISEWGHDFRPAYREIAAARPLLTSASGEPAPVVAVTATATPEVRRDVIAQLELRDPTVVVRGFDRPNLVWSVHHVENKAQQVRDVFEGVPGAGLVYAGTRRATEEWARRLRRNGIGAEPYHAGLDAETRTAVQRRWLAGETRVVTATSAFGMGIDKPDVRAVVHVALPPTLESYYQEAGRAGRDGERAYCALVLGPADDALPRAMAEGAHPTADQVQAVYAAASSLAGVGLGAQPDGATPVDLGRVAKVAGVTPPLARASLEHLARQGVWSVREPRADRVTLRVAASASALRGGAEGAMKRFVEALLRTLPPDAFSDWATVALARLAEATGLPPDRTLAGLRFLQQRGSLEMLDPSAGLVLDWAAPRGQRAPVDATALAAGRQRALAGVDRVIAYAESVGCRRQHLLAYFGERAPSRCGRCDVCLGRHAPDVVTPADEADLLSILAHADAGDPRSEWLPESTPRRRDALTRWLLADGLLALSDPLADRYTLTPKGLKALRRADASPA